LPTVAAEQIGGWMSSGESSACAGASLAKIAAANFRKMSQ
jgi:hypothetical protein